jgi:hypothetical protein
MTFRLADQFRLVLSPMRCYVHYIDVARSAGRKRLWRLRVGAGNLFVLDPLLAVAVREVLRYNHVLLPRIGLRQSSELPIPQFDRMGYERRARFQMLHAV